MGVPYPLLQSTLSSSAFSIYRAWLRMQPPGWKLAAAFVTQKLGPLTPETYNVSTPERQIDTMQAAFRQAFPSALP